MSPPTAPKARLGSWIRLAVITSVVSATLTLFLVVDHFARHYALQQTHARLQQLAWQMRDTLDRGIHERFTDMNLLRTAVESQSSAHPATVRKLLENLQHSQPHYAWVGLTDANGKVLVATNGLLEGMDVSQRPWFQGAKSNAFTGDYHPAVLLEKKLPQRDEPWRFIDVALPLKGANDELRGVLGAHLSWGWIRDLAQRLFNPAQAHYSVEIFIVRKDGTVLLGPKQYEEKKIGADSLLLAREHSAGGAATETWPDGEYVVGYAQTLNSPAEGMGWSILVRQPLHMALDDFANLKQHLILAGLLTMLILAVIAAVFTRRLLQPLQDLTEAIERRTGDEAGTGIPVVGGFHEAHLLSTTLIDLVEAEKTQRHALRRLNETLENEVDERTRALLAAANQLQTALIEQSNAKEQLQKIVLLDALTGLPNRRAFHEELPKAMARAQRDNHDLAVLFLDLDGFKAVNDTHGHEAGDELLRQFATRISACVRKTDMVARLAGDEFVVILERLILESDASDVAGKILHEMTTTFDLGAAQVTLSSSVGIALFAPNGTQSSDQLLHAADQAMYAAKHAGKNRIHVAKRSG